MLYNEHTCISVRKSMRHQRTTMLPRQRFRYYLVQIRQYPALWPWTMVCVQPRHVAALQPIDLVILSHQHQPHQGASESLLLVQPVPPGRHCTWSVPSTSPPQTHILAHLSSLSPSKINRVTLESQVCSLTFHCCTLSLTLERNGLWKHSCLEGHWANCVALLAHVCTYIVNNTCTQIVREIIRHLTLWGVGRQGYEQIKLITLWQ